TSRWRGASPPSAAWLTAGIAAGHPVTDDCNGAEQHGLARMQVTIRNGRRCSAADAYLRPALRRPNLRVVVRAHATRIVLEHGRATGVEYQQGGQKRVARAERELL